jgi:hypothetical protein
MSGSATPASFKRPSSRSRYAALIAAFTAGAHAFSPATRLQFEQFTTLRGASGLLLCVICRLPALGCYRYFGCSGGSRSRSRSGRPPESRPTMSTSRSHSLAGRSSAGVDTHSTQSRTGARDTYVVSLYDDHFPTEMSTASGEPKFVPAKVIQCC